MTKHEIIQRYGTTAAQFARDLGTTKQVVHNWGDWIPPHWAMDVSRLTKIPVEEILDTGHERGSRGRHAR